MKKNYALGLICLGLMNMDSLHAQAFEQDGIIYQINKDEVSATALSAVDRDVKKIVFPTTVTQYGINYTLTDIEKWGFKNLKSLEEVVFPENLQTVQLEAFADCGMLKKVTFSSQLKKLERGAFQDCTKLDELIIPDDMHLETIETDVFYDTAWLHTPQTGGHYFANVFYQLTDPDATTLKVKPGTTLMAPQACKDHKKLETVILPEGMEYMGTQAFHKCRNLKTCSIPESVTTLSKLIFLSCSSLTNVNIPKAVTTLPPSLFAGCSSLKNIEIPQGVKLIDDNAFSGCDALEEVILPDSLETLNMSCFEDCNSLTRIVIPRYVKNLSFNCFTGVNLKEYHLLATNLSGDAGLTLQIPGYEPNGWDDEDKHLVYDYDNAETATIGEPYGMVELTGKPGCGYVSVSRTDPETQETQMLKVAVFAGGCGVTIPENGYTTFTAPTACTLNKELMGGIVKGIKQGEAEIEYVYQDEAYVPASEAMIIYGKPGIYLMPTAEIQEGVAPRKDNLLKPSLSDQKHTSTTDTQLYVLGDGPRGLAFYPKEGEKAGQEVSHLAGKAYLEVPATEADHEGLRIVDMNHPTGIDEVTAAPTAVKSIIYNLNGVRQTMDDENLPEGIYVINGKKVLVK